MREYPSFHDGRLRGFVMLPEIPPHSECIVFIADVDGKNHRITLSGVEALRADGFREGNIVLDMTVETGPAVRTEEALYPYAIKKNGAFPAFAEKVLMRVHSSQLMLVQINPSYGCSFTCLCTSCVVDPIEASPSSLRG